MAKIDLNTHFKGTRDMNQKETLQLLQSYGMLFWSWGASGFTALGKRALAFRVNGHHHKGLIFISVNGSDLYNVDIVEKNHEIKETITDLYFDQLFDAIDTRIEKIDDYVR